MTRVAIVADSEELRGALADALRSSAAFDIVSSSASADAIAASAEVVLVARPARAQQRVPQRARQSAPTSATAAADNAREAPALSNREREILALLADGLGNKQIAGRLGISTSTVKTHLELLFDKLAVTSRAEAVAAAVRRGWLFL
ncbi:MAG TPA: helix-turn-helix transcriptional regulator [Gemmatimonadaceae bacterium]|nr:helix-turn-helix transcriptional regulator [Gemmatimonadaceae bacterium]